MSAREPPGLLDLVTTVSEVVQTRFYSEKTVRRWIETGKVRARQSGSTWLIEVPSLLQHLAALTGDAPLTEFRPDAPCADARER